MKRRGTLTRRGVSILKKEETSSWPSWWVFMSWCFTCCFPASLLNAMNINGLKHQAWREKVALCWLVGLLSLLVVFFLVFFNYLLCPPSITDSTITVNAFGGVVVFGQMYDSINMAPPYNTLFEGTDSSYSGIDVSGSFRQPLIPACQKPSVAKFAISQVSSLCEPDSCLDLGFLMQNASLNLYTRITGSSGSNVTVSPVPAYEWSEVQRRRFITISQTVLNLQSYFSQYPLPVPNDPVDATLRTAQQTNDGTHLFWKDPNFTPDVIECLVNKYQTGVLSQLPMSCILSRLVTILVTLMVISIIATRFIMAVIFDWFLSSRISRIPSKDLQSRASASLERQRTMAANRYRLSALEPIDPKTNSSPGLAITRKRPNAKSPLPNEYDIYTVCLVTCYSEGEVSLRGTLDGLAATDYDDAKKLLFVISDGLVKGAGNALSTPELLLRMMEQDNVFGVKSEAYSYVAVASGSKQHNMARVYCGSYPYQNRAIPMIVVIKCGTPDEQSLPKPGNRGKRDSQLILMNFFSRVVLNDRMTPLDYDLFRKIRHVSGVTPDTFDIVLMVDADTKVAPDSLRYMINTMQNDALVVGLCGETRVSNPTQSWVTRIQVFEYFISHHLGKAFESVFGGVTCLPGCFCMYRIKTIKDSSTLPILVNPEIIEQYSTNEVYTLHQKNLLLLGEDRFLTTLMLRTFPRRKMVYVPSSHCETVVPDDFKTLVSQRRRWINSTIHNLMELVLVKNLCGTFCFSMQFVVFMDLIGTAVLPATLCTMYYLVIAAIMKINYTDLTSILNLSTILVVLFLPAILVAITGKRPTYIYWMLIYLLALPIWQFVLPLYAFWNFDDFSWGETRKVTGDDKIIHGEDEQGLFDGTKIPFKRWEEYERDARRVKTNQHGDSYGPYSGSSSSSTLYGFKSVPSTRLQSLSSSNLPLHSSSSSNLPQTHPLDMGIRRSSNSSLPVFPMAQMGQSLDNFNFSSANYKLSGPSMPALRSLASNTPRTLAAPAGPFVPAFSPTSSMASSSTPPMGMPSLPFSPVLTKRLSSTPAMGMSAPSPAPVMPKRLSSTPPMGISALPSTSVMPRRLSSPPMGMPTLPTAPTVPKRLSSIYSSVGMSMNSYTYSPPSRENSMSTLSPPSHPRGPRELPK